MYIIDLKPNFVNRKGYKSKLQQTVIDGCIVIFLFSSMLRVDILVMYLDEICQNLDNGDGYFRFCSTLWKLRFIVCFISVERHFETACCLLFHFTAFPIS